MGKFYATHPCDANFELADTRVGSIAPCRYKRPIHLAPQIQIRSMALEYTSQRCGRSVRRDLRDESSRVEAAGSSVQETYC